jgi:phosphoglycerate dehydrogenase-like enzyme
MTTVSVPTQDGRRELTGLQGDDALPDDVRVLVWDGKGDAPDGADDIDLFVGLYNSAPPPRETFAALPQLKVIQLLSAGVEPWLPVVPEGVELCNGRGIHGGSTAELAVAGLLALLRRLPHAWRAQQRHEWDQVRAQGLDGRRVLVLGAGDIGDRIAAAARIFDADVTVVARRSRDGVHALDELPQLLPDHDVVVIALPQTPQTAGLVDADFLAALPDGAVVVNIARGGIVDTDALLAELTSRRLHAFLDVTDPEPLPADHLLWDEPDADPARRRWHQAGTGGLTGWWRRRRGG